MARRKMATQACAPCRAQRKKCSADCVLAPYFPSSDQHKFEVVQKIFGLNKVVKMLQGVPVEQRADVVDSMVYEARARVMDPIHGCASAVDRLKKRITALESQLAAAQAELDTMRLEQDKLLSLLSTASDDARGHVSDATKNLSEQNQDFMLWDDDPFLLWEPLCCFKSSNLDENYVA